MAVADGHIFIHHGRAQIAGSPLTHRLAKLGGGGAEPCHGRLERTHRGLHDGALNVFHGNSLLLPFGRLHNGQQGAGPRARKAGVGVAQLERIAKLAAAVIGPRGGVGRDTAHIEPAQFTAGPAQRFGDRLPHGNDQRAFGHAVTLPLIANCAQFGQHIHPCWFVGYPQVG